jgi:D-sedoheptulose 7-phosphate isomerase
LPGIADSYYASLQAALAKGPPAELTDVADTVFAAFLRGSSVYTVGNGGSAALAAHIACDWGMSCAVDLGRPATQIPARRLRITPLPGSATLMTGYSNDHGYENVFVEQLKCLLDKDDVIVAISGSGASPNVLRAAEYATALGASVIGFTGSAPTAEALASRCDVTVRAPVTGIQQIEDLHVTFNHIVALTLKERVRDHLAATGLDLR